MKNEYTLSVFFRQLDLQGVNYCVLRWFEGLPDVQSGEDVDILIADADLPKIKKYFTYFEKAGGQKFDIYTASFKRGNGYRELSYISTYLARDILANTRQHESQAYVPAHKVYKLSFIYHVLFHKAEKSGFTRANFVLGEEADHNYQQFMRDQFSIDMKTLDQLFDYLKSHDFVPPIDTMKKLAAVANSEGLRCIVSEYESNRFPKDGLSGEIVCLVVREQLGRLDVLSDALEDAIARESLEVIERINVEGLSEFTCKCRGNNWGAGPWPNSGGQPVQVIFAYKQLGELKPNKEGFLSEQSGIKVKERVRIITEQNVLFSTFNGVHTSDTTHEALEYASFIAPSLPARLLEKSKVLASYDAALIDFKVKAKLTRLGRRADVYEIDYLGSSAILKIFKFSFLEYFEREKEFYTRYTGGSIPKLLASGSNYLITEKVCNLLSVDSLYKPRDGSLYKKQIAEFIWECFHLGYFNPDLMEHNVLVSERKLFFIDFEYMQKYQEASSVPYEYLDLVNKFGRRYSLPMRYRRNPESRFERRFLQP